MLSSSRHTRDAAPFYSTYHTVLDAAPSNSRTTSSTPRPTASAGTSRASQLTSGSERATVDTARDNNAEGLNPLRRPRTHEQNVRLRPGHAHRANLVIGRPSGLLGLEGAKDAQFPRVNFRLHASPHVTSCTCVLGIGNLHTSKEFLGDLIVQPSSLLLYTSPSALQFRRIFSPVLRNEPSSAPHTRHRG